MEEGPGLGTIVVDDVIARVVRIHMEAGAFIVTAIVAGPVAARPEAEYDLRIHGVDGRVVMGGRMQTGWPEAIAGDTVELSFAAMPLQNEFNQTGQPHPLVDGDENG